jgi:hypothetical protein
MEKAFQPDCQNAGQDQTHTVSSTHCGPAAATLLQSSQPSIEGIAPSEQEQHFFWKSSIKLCIMHRFDMHWTTCATAKRSLSAWVAQTLVYYVEAHAFAGSGRRSLLVRSSKKRYPRKLLHGDNRVCIIETVVDYRSFALLLKHRLELDFFGIHPVRVIGVKVHRSWRVFQAVCNVPC